METLNDTLELWDKQTAEEKCITAIRSVAWANNWSCVDRYSDGDLLELLSECQFKAPLVMRSLKLLHESDQLSH